MSGNKTNPTVDAEYSFLEPVTTEEEPEIELTKDQDTVLTNILKHLSTQPLSVVKLAAQLVNLALVVPTVFNGGVDAVEDYLKAAQSQISQPGLFAHVSGGLVTGRSATDIHLHYPGLPLLTLPSGSTGETLLNGKIALRAGKERKVAFHLRPGTIKQGDILDTKDIPHLSYTKFAFQATSALPRENTATLDMRGLINPARNLPLTAAELVATKRIVRAKFTGAILLDGAVGEVNLGAYSVDPPLTPPFPASYAWDAERKHGIIQKWVDSLPATAFQVDLKPTRVAQAAPDISEYFQDLAAAAPRNDRDGGDSDFDDAASESDSRSYTLGCGAGGHQLLEATLANIQLYKGTYADNSTYARDMFPKEAAHHKAAPNGLTKRITHHVTDATTTNLPLNTFINEFIVLSGIHSLLRRCDVAKLIAFCLVKTNLLQVGEEAPHIISKRG